MAAETGEQIKPIQVQLADELSRNGFLLPQNLVGYMVQSKGRIRIGPSPRPPVWVKANDGWPYSTRMRARFCRVPSVTSIRVYRHPL
jgi:hypothetical protein